jgi:hypothetical protein
MAIVTIVTVNDFRTNFMHYKVIFGSIMGVLTMVIDIEKAIKTDKMSFFRVG